MAAADSRTVRETALAHGGHLAVLDADVATGVPFAAADAGSVCKIGVGAGDDALRRERPGTRDGHGRDPLIGRAAGARNFQTGSILAADEGARAAVGQRDVRFGAGNDLEGAIVIAAQVDVDVRERDVRRHAFGHDDAVASRLRDPVAHGEGQLLARQDRELAGRVVVGVVAPKRSALHLEVARQAGHREGIVNVAAVEHAASRDGRLAVHPVVFNIGGGIGRAEQAAGDGDVDRAIDAVISAIADRRTVAARPHCDAATRNSDGTTGTPSGAADTRTRCITAAFARNAHRATRYLDGATRATDTGTECSKTSGFTRGGYLTAPYLNGATYAADT